MIKNVLLAGAVIALCNLAAVNSQAENIDLMPPVVIKTIPEAGAKDVPAGEMEIKVTFSKEMQDKTWSWASVWKDSSPEIIGKPRYESDGKTCVVKVKLEAGKAYGYWVNSPNFKNFKDKGNRPAIPYLLTFQTK